MNLKLNKKLTLTIGIISTIISFITTAISMFIFAYHTERKIERDLISKHYEVVELAKPKTSQELATYLRSNNLSMLFFDSQRKVVAKYGIYRELNDKELISIIKSLKEPSYKDMQIGKFGTYDTYTDKSIQISTKNEVLSLITKSFYVGIILLLPVIWIISIIASFILTKIILSPLLKARKISHELRTPLARAVVSLQGITENLPKKYTKEIKVITEDLLDMGRNAENLLKISSNSKDKTEKSDLIKVLQKILKDSGKSERIKINTVDHLYVAISKGLLSIILRNLLENSFKYSPKESFVDIQIIKKTKLNYWKLNITNQLKTKNLNYGNGLGLKIVEEICSGYDLDLSIKKHSKSFSVEISGKNL